MIAWWTYESISGNLWLLLWFQRCIHCSVIGSAICDWILVLLLCDAVEDKFCDPWTSLCFISFMGICPLLSLCNWIFWFHLLVLHLIRHLIDTSREFEIYSWFLVFFELCFSIMAPMSKFELLIVIDSHYDVLSKLANCLLINYASKWYLEDCLDILRKKGIQLFCFFKGFYRLFLHSISIGFFSHIIVIAISKEMMAWSNNRSPFFIHIIIITITNEMMAWSNNHSPFLLPLSLFPWLG